ncbi:uncharacterized protein JN550_000742 [Neoarthrinium moseri]|uniref:uncharacterized protein n=1 Tax=Neoarthrinium moseri TaxID=1658444 RepID=UPI001FDDA335|nr:uncharacterized protein JN550_000742 [Neoarthrinium moseri]KAI1876670.1 hypothetical protein JN550_000742 [Neoarthrinium moseri]
MKTILKKPAGESSSKRNPTPQRSRSTRGEIMATSIESPSESPAKTEPQYPGAARIPRTQIHEERARKLGTNYGVEIEPGDWHSAEGEVYRIEKPVRIRIHRDCHRPPKRTESQKKANREKREAAAQQHQEFAPIIPHYGLAEPIVVTRPSKTGGQALVHKPPRMRVRRNCHKCATLFTPNNRICGTCGHTRCDDCPKSPNKKKKYPYGYPGDEPGPKSSSFHACHECNEKFPPNSEDGTECAQCSHEKCASCPRVPRVKVQPEPDAELLRGISSRFEQLELS